jgi:ribosomal protein S18 acetylase RimI-like enzyme
MLVSIGVLETARARGVGRALLERLTDDLPHGGVLMTTGTPRTRPGTSTPVRAGR